MYFEVYIDTLFLLHFFLNFYLLELVNRKLFYVASLKRIMFGAVLGACCAIVPLLLPLKMIYSTIFSFLMATCIMTVYTFRVVHIEQFRKVIEKMFIMTLLLGGILLFILKLLPKKKESYQGILAVMAVGAISYLIVCKLMKEGKERNICKVTLLGDKGEVQVEALMDTGNGLIEPISGAPVSVLDEETFRLVFGKELPELYRPIPYHSIGKSAGILKGYQLNVIRVEFQGAKKDCYKAYVAVSEELVKEKSHYRMILNPRLLEY